MTLHQVLAATCLVLSFAVAPANAGPYFNSNGKEIKDTSKAAVKDLSDGRIAAINMLTALDAGDQGKAADYRKTALLLLRKSFDEFAKIESIVPNQSIQYSLFKTDEEKRIRAELEAALARSKKEFPKTEKDLARLAVEYVRNYANTIEQAKLEGFPKQWQGVRQIILSEAELIYIGNLVSIVWTITEQ